MQYDRAHPPRSLELVEAIARYLVDEACVANFYIWCGYRVPERKWKMLIMFNQKEMSKEAAAEAWQTIVSPFPLSRSLGAQQVEPEVNQPIGKLRQTAGPMGIVAKWIKAEGWSHMTKLVGPHGHFFPPVRTGAYDMTEQRA